MISDSALQSFKKLWMDEFNEELPDDQAVKLAVNLLTFFDRIYKPIKKEWLPAVSGKENLTKPNITKL